MDRHSKAKKKNREFSGTGTTPRQGRAGGTEISSPWLGARLKGGRERREAWLRAAGFGSQPHSPAAVGARGESLGKMSPCPRLPHCFERAADDTTASYSITGFHGKYCVTGEFMNSRQEKAEEPENLGNRTEKRQVRDCACTFTSGLCVWSACLYARTPGCTAATANSVSSRLQ